MISSTTKTSLLIAIIYLVCFQLFLQSGFYSWLYAGNILFCIAAVYCFFYNQRNNTALSLPAATRKAVRLVFSASFAALIGCIVLCVINYYFFPFNTNEYFNLIKGNGSVFPGISTVSSFAVYVFANAFVVNIVLGSLACFFTAGIINERRYFEHSRPLPSVKKVNHRY